MKKLIVSVFVVACAGAIGCDSADSSISGTFTWDFDYRNWINESSVAVPRTCANQGTDTDPAIPSYPAVDEVHVVLTDPAGEVDGADTTVSCEVGESGFDLKGIPSRELDFVLEGADRDGEVMYSLAGTGLDFSKKVDESFTLLAVVGETRMSVGFPAAVTDACAIDLETVVVGFHVKDGGNVAEQPAYEYEHPVCDDDGEVTHYIRNIPAEPVPGTVEGSLGAALYQIVVRVYDSNGAVAYCGVDVERSISPGREDNDNDDVPVTAGDCAL
jgi:hypothetical protein